MTITTAEKLNLRGRRSDWIYDLYVAVGVVLIQILSLALVAGETGLAAAYRQFCEWDCGAYARIAEIGYPKTISYPPPPYNDLVEMFALLGVLPQIAWCLEQGELAQNLTLFALLVSVMISFFLEGNFGHLYLIGTWIG